MKNNFSKWISQLMTTSCLIALPIFANAQTLSIVNSTHMPISFSVNGVCSQEIQPVYPMDVETISPEVLDRVCNSFSTACEIIGFDGKNCGGQSLGGLTYVNSASIIVSGSDKRSVNVRGSIGANESSLFYKSII